MATDRTEYFKAYHRRRQDTDPEYRKRKLAHARASYFARLPIWRQLVEDGHAANVAQARRVQAKRNRRNKRAKAKRVGQARARHAQDARS